MGISFFKEGSFTGLKTNLDGSAIRHKLITNNIANQNTPQYVSRDLNFNMYIKMASDQPPRDKMITTNSRHIENDMFGLQNPDAFSSNITERMTMMRVNSSPEEEMVKLAENSLQHKASLELLNRKYKIFGTAITGVVK